jgi:hypothetical protein
MKNLALLLAAMLPLTGCVVHTEHAGPTRHDSASFDRGNAEVVRANLKMGVGTMRIGPGTSDKLVRAEFDYNVPSWKPDVDYNDGTLRISQPETHQAHLGDTKYEWDLRINRDVPLELTITFGTGEARLNLGDLMLRRVDIQMGVGEVQLDLRGSPKQSYDVRIRGGVGEATVRLPSNVGVYADVRGGIGEVSARGMRQDGSAYYNDLYKKSPTTIRLDVEGGVGSIKLITE